jgi:hypothetical protein
MSGLTFTAKELGKTAAGRASGLGALLAQGRKVSESGMNKTEEAFSRLLEEAKTKGEIIAWHFEAITLKVAANTRYRPDFLAVLPDGHWQFFEIKGYLRDDAAVKFKAAPEKFPECSFMMLRRKRGEWMTVYNLPSKFRKSQTPAITLDQRKESPENKLGCKPKAQKSKASAKGQ